MPKDGVNCDLVILALQQTKVVETHHTPPADDVYEGGRVQPSTSISSDTSWQSNSYVAPLHVQLHRCEVICLLYPPLPPHHHHQPCSSKTDAPSFLEMATARLGPNWRICASDHTLDNTSDVQCVVFCRVDADVTVMDHTHQVCTPSRFYPLAECGMMSVCISA